MKHLNGRAIAVSAMIAAVYTAVSLALSLFSFGVMQIRVAECLTLLPVLSPLGIYGVTVGCLLTNIVGTVLGLTMPVDILFGTLATAIAAVLSYLLRNVRIKRLAIPAALRRFFPDPYWMHLLSYMIPERQERSTAAA